MRIVLWCLIIASVLIVSAYIGFAMVDARIDGWAAQSMLHMSASEFDNWYAHGGWLISMSIVASAVTIGAVAYAIWHSFYRRPKPRYYEDLGEDGMWYETRRPD
jgi:hypothetical protein